MKHLKKLEKNIHYVTKKFTQRNAREVYIGFRNAFLSIQRLEKVKKNNIEVLSVSGATQYF